MKELATIDNSNAGPLVCFSADKIQLAPFNKPFTKVIGFVHQDNVESSEGIKAIEDYFDCNPDGELLYLAPEYASLATYILQEWEALIRNPDSDLTEQGGLIATLSASNGGVFVYFIDGECGLEFLSSIIEEKLPELSMHEVLAFDANEFELTQGQDVSDDSENVLLSFAHIAEKLSKSSLRKHVSPYFAKWLVSELY